jgi:Putative Flp pilus-assembly TadE/G-like
MGIRRLSSEIGQSLVIVALGLVAFIAILALVLDGGNAYAAKRQAQNAADAGALAGAQYMCEHRDEAGGIEQAVAYVEKNGGIVNLPDDVFASLSSHTVRVTATVIKDTFFAGVIGFPQVSPRAIAEAQCRPPTGIGVMPVAWACRAPVVGGIPVPGIDCAEKLGPCGTGAAGLACTYIMMDSVKVKEKGKKCDPDITDPTDPKYCYQQNDLVCSAHGPDLTPPHGCDYVEPTKTDCDLDNDCIDELMTGGARSWLDLNGGGGGANELKNWIQNGFPDPIVPHTWLPEESGVATSIFHTTAQYTVGKDVTLPVFEKLCDHYPNDLTNPETLAACNVGSIDVRDLAGNNMNFHIVTFATFHVTCVQTAKNKVTAEPGYVFIDKKECNGHGKAVAVGSIDDNDKTIEGYFKELNIGGYGGPGVPFDAGTFTVVLVR